MDDIQNLAVSRDGHFFAIDALPEAHWPSGTTARLLSGTQLMLVFFRVPPDLLLPEHTHPHEQLGYIVEGSMWLTIGGTERELHPGDSYVIPRGVPHSGRCGPAGCVLVDAFAPPRNEFLAFVVP